MTVPVRYVLLYNAADSYYDVYQAQVLCDNAKPYRIAQIFHVAKFSLIG